MVSSLPTESAMLTDEWVKATWEEFLTVVEQPIYEKAQCYYDDGWMRSETMPIGAAHGRDNGILSQVVTLYGALRLLRFVGFTNTSFRKTGERECQPDLAYYIGADFVAPPKTNAPVDINLYGAPTLTIEIASTSLNDDLAQKRLLYERLGVQEYWVANVAERIVHAFEVSNCGSRQIRTSLVLPGLEMTIIETAMQQSQTQDDAEITRWLMAQFSGVNE